MGDVTTWMPPWFCYSMFLRTSVGREFTTSRCSGPLLASSGQLGDRVGDVLLKPLDLPCRSGAIAAARTLPSVRDARPTRLTAADRMQTDEGANNPPRVFRGPRLVSAPEHSSLETLNASSRRSYKEKDSRLLKAVQSSPSRNDSGIILAFEDPPRVSYQHRRALMPDIVITM